MTARQAYARRTAQAPSDVLVTGNEARRTTPWVASDWEMSGRRDVDSNLILVPTTGLEMRKPPEQAVIRWRDPDSNRGHHDFQTVVRSSRTSGKVPARQPVFGSEGRDQEVRKLHAIVGTVGHETPLVSQWPGYAQVRACAGPVAAPWPSGSSRGVLHCSGRSRLELRSCALRASAAPRRRRLLVVIGRRDCGDAAGAGLE
jgi:hypothetical protein